MKFCRAIPLAALIGILLLSLTGCIMIPLQNTYTYSASDVSSVWIYDWRDSNSKADLDSPSYTLEEDQIEDFLNDFAQLEFTDYIIITIAAVDPSFNYGKWVVRINFTDGSYVMHSCGGYQESFNSSGELVESNHYECELEDLEELIGKYYAFEPSESLTTDAD